MFRKTFIASFFLQVLIYSILSCDIPGRFRCNSNCSGYYICSNGMDDMYTCSGGQHCDMIKQNCSSEVSSCGPEGYQFQCSSEGLYPDPYDCTKYYICGPPPGKFLYDPEPGEDGTDFRHSCPDGLAYNPGSTVCDFNLTADVCKYGPVPKCNVFYQTDSLTTNQSIFYICIKISNDVLVPQLFRCDSGYYNSTTCKCSDSNFFLENNLADPCFVNDTQTTTFTTEETASTLFPTEGTTSTFLPTESSTDEGTTSTLLPTESSTEGTTSSSSQTEETTSTLPPTTTTTSSSETESTTSEPPESTTHIPFVCSSPGIFPDPYDCYSYYICNVHLHLFHYTCPEGSHFDPSTSECEEGDECSPLSTQTTGTVTTTTGETSTHAPFLCDGPGLFPDCYDCHAFYRCTVTGHMYHEHCPIGSYFAVDIKDCVMGEDCPDPICD